MKIALYGATGTIGTRIAQEALSRGHEVTAVLRDPARLALDHPRLRKVKGEVTDPAGIASTVRGLDAVISAIGPRTPGEVGVLESALRALVDGLKRAGLKRLVVVGGAGSLEVAPGALLMDTPQFPKEWRPLAAAHFDALKYLTSVRDLDWSYLSPAALIQPGSRTGAYRVGFEQLLTDAKGNSAISTEDYALALIDELEHPRHVRERITVAY